MNRIKIIEGFLKRYAEFARSVLKDHAGLKGRDEYSVYLFNFIERFYYATDAVLCLVPKLSDFHYKYPLAILLRNILADHLTAMYFMSHLRYENDAEGSAIIIDDEFLEATHRIDRTTFRIIKKLLEEEITNGKITEEKRTEMMLNLQRHCPNQFETDSDGVLKFKKREELKPGDIARYLRTSKYPEAAGAYEYYSYYSQFEHVSRLSKTILYKNYETTDIPAFIATIRYLFGTTWLIIVNMRLNDSYVMGIMQLLEEFVTEFPPRNTP